MFMSLQVEMKWPNEISLRIACVRRGDFRWVSRLGQRTPANGGENMCVVTAETEFLKAPGTVDQVRDM